MGQRSSWGTRYTTWDIATVTQIVIWYWSLVVITAAQIPDLGCTVCPCLPIIWTWDCGPVHRNSSFLDPWTKSKYPPESCWGAVCELLRNEEHADPGRMQDSQTSRKGKTEWRCGFWKWGARSWLSGAFYSHSSPRAAVTSIQGYSEAPRLP